VEIDAANRPARTRSGPTFGVLADWLEGEYQSAVVGGMVEAARELGVNLVVLASSMLRTTFRFGERQNVVYDLARSDGIDGLVVMAGTVGNYLGLDDLARYCERFRPRPMCSVAAPLKGMTGILVDGEEALRQGIRHLVEDHKYNRIACIAGPEENVEARARLRLYREVLTEHGLETPESFVVSGEFRYGGGVEAVRVLLDERGVVPDAIVAGSDQVALGAIDALRAHNIRVPREVAMIGFDDISEASYCAPPLTTVRQPLRQQGMLAVQVLLRRLRGEQVDDVYVLPAELVFRRSCGCYSDSRRVSVTAQVPTPQTGPAPHVAADEALAVRRPRSSTP